jgi:hypothetical protein
MYNFFLPLSDYIGLTGVVLLLLGYFAVSIDLISSKSLTYQLLNFTAAWLLLFSLYFHWNTASVVIEIAWIIISVMGMCRIVLSRQYDQK